jgi:hypothetical protein
MVDCIVRQRKESRQGMQPTAKSLWDKLKSEEAKIRERLATMEEEFDLAVELHAPSGTVIRIGAIAYFPYSNDTLRIQGIDVRTREACQAIVSVRSFYVIFRFTRVEGRESERKPIGFHIEGEEGSEET